MFKIQKLNKISQKGLTLFDPEKYEIASEILNPDAIILRSYKMHDMEIPQTVKAIARAGAGVNNIPVEKCTEKGIVVFNTPGANANSVKELTIASLLLSSRGIVEGIEWVKSIKDKKDEIPALVEKNKSMFAGTELKGKKIAIIGLGAIGVMVANACVGLEMEVLGYDPYISVEAAWGLSREVKRADSIDKMITDVDYITIHVPLLESTKGLLNKERFALMKKGVKIVNISRGGLVNNRDLIEAIENGIVDKYVTDFPDENILKNDKIICIPHLGASTKEAEDNCAVMAVNQLMDYLEYGNIKNSVNFPTAVMDKNPNTIRITIANKNIPNMVGQITSVLASKGINIAELLNKHKNDIAYNIIDIDSANFEESIEDELKKIDGVIMVRIIK